MKNTTIQNRSNLFVLLALACSSFLHPTALLATSSHKHSTKESVGENHLFLLRKSMATKAPDIERVDRIIHQYKKLISETSLSKKEQHSIERWFSDASIFLGSRHYDHSLLYDRVPKLKRNSKFQKAYKTFVSNITTSQKVAPSTIQKNIAILFTGCYGGGHKTAAHAIGQHFEKMGHKIQLIDVDQIEDHYSPTVNGYTKAQIYQEVYQKEGNVEKAHFLENEIKKIQTVESNRYLQDIKEMLTDFQATHIFSVAHHRPELGYLSYQLEIPMLYIHTDFVFQKKLIPILREQEKLKNPLIKFSVLSNDRSFFKNVEALLEIKPKKFSRQINRQLIKFGFPVRSSFTKVTPSEVGAIRQSLNIPTDAVVCKLAMGQNALVQEIQDIVQRMRGEKISTHQEIHLFVVCGKNDLLKTHLEELLAKKRTNDKKLHVHILGFLNEQEMARIDLASDVWISKPGGSTCAELLETQKQMLYVFNANHPWEALNAAHIERLKLGSALSTKKPILEQIYKRIRVHRKINLDKLPSIDWKEKATEFLYVE